MSPVAGIIKKNNFNKFSNFHKGVNNRNIKLKPNKLEQLKSKSSIERYKKVDIIFSNKLKEAYSIDLKKFVSNEFLNIGIKVTFGTPKKPGVISYDEFIIKLTKNYNLFIKNRRVEKRLKKIYKFRSTEYESKVGPISNKEYYNLMLNTINDFKDRAN